MSVSLSKREHWRTEALRFTDEVTRLQNQVAALKEEKEVKDLLIESMKKVLWLFFCIVCDLSESCCPNVG